MYYLRRKQMPPKPVCINGEEVVRDDTYKYLLNLFVLTEKRW